MPDTDSNGRHHRHELYKGHISTSTQQSVLVMPGGEEQGEKKHAMRGEQEKERQSPT